MIPKECIIWGGGYSIKEGISLGLQDHLKGKFVINCNYSFLHFPGTLLTFLDRDFYVPIQAKEKGNKHPDIYEKLKKIPLIIGIDYNNGVQEFILPNTILLKKSVPYNKNPIEKGFYYRSLTGVFSLFLASFLIDFKGVIYLLGFDETKKTKEIFLNKRKPHTHYYEEETNHSGIGDVRVYHKSRDRFLPFTKEKDLHIYNVSPDSNINCFEKIDYTTFFSKLDNVVYEQENLRKEIKKKLVG